MPDDFGLPKGPNGDFWFGADQSGRDVFVRVLYGARTSLLVASSPPASPSSIGVVLGLIAGYFRGCTDTLISRAHRHHPRAAAAPLRDRHRRGLRHDEGRLPRRADRARARARHLRHRALHLALHRAHRPRQHALDPREGVRRGEPLARRRATSGSCSARCCRTSIAPIIVYTTLLIPSNILFEAALSFLGARRAADHAVLGQMLVGRSRRSSTSPGG